MELTVHRNDKGFSLLEAMLAVFILTIMMLWSLQGLVTVNQSVSQNKIRQEAVSLGQELLVDARSMDTYVTLPVGDTTVDMSRQVASYDVVFSVNRVVDAFIPGVSKSVVYTISWDGGNHTYIARTVVSNQ